ncbi:MAG TPA: hypothetical protein VJZ73_13425 [Methylomirabilota bacterium]|nr:hypothetical protein [Methylomirabilota bacterium]
MHSLPSHLHSLAILADRRAQLDRQAEAAVLTGRILATIRRADGVLASLPQLDEPAQPTMARLDGTGYRSQPRDGRGRLLGKAWLRRAESYSAADLAWFRSAIRCTEGK